MTQTFLYPNEMPSQEPITTWILTGEEPTYMMLPYPPMPNHLKTECGTGRVLNPAVMENHYVRVNFDEREVQFVYKIRVAWMALHAYWAWCVGTPRISNRDFAHVAREVQRMEEEDEDVSTLHIFPLENHCPNTWSPTKQPNFSFVPSRYPSWIRDLMRDVPAHPVMPWTHAIADPRGYYTALRNYQPIPDPNLRKESKAVRIRKTPLDNSSQSV